MPRIESGKEAPVFNPFVNFALLITTAIAISYLVSILE